LRNLSTSFLLEIFVNNDRATAKTAERLEKNIVLMTKKTSTVKWAKNTLLCREKKTL